MADKKAAALALLSGVNLAADFHTLNSATVERLAEVARAVGYRKSRNANGSTARCFFEYLTRQPKTELLYVVQGNYGQGWEDLTASTDYSEARRDLKSYRDNDPAPTRLIKRRSPV